MSDLTEAADTNTATLSPVEHVFCGPGGYTINFVFSFSSTLDRERLQNSLVQTVAQFPWVWSQLRESADQRSLRLVPLDQPVLLETGEPPVSPHGRGQFVGSVETEIGAPLARFRLTQTSAGSVLGVSMSHALADGASIFHFLTSWARIAKGETIFAPVRVAIPHMPPVTDDPTPAQIWSDSGFYSGGPRKTITSEALTEELLYVTHDQLKAMLASAQQESGVRLSTNDVVTAHLWQKFGPAWCDEAGEREASVTCAVDMRSVIDIPRTHFGSAVGFAVAKMEVDRLRAAPLGEVAARVRQAIKAVDAPRLLAANGTLQRLRDKDGIRGVQSLQLRHPRTGMNVANMTRAPISELDFGGGAPSSFLADAQQDHAAAFYAHPDGLELHVYGSRPARSLERPQLAPTGMHASTLAQSRLA
jgi:shikimate O-hydroxycinnamoyltransferase